MNKTLMFVTFAIIATLGLVGYIVLLAIDPTPDEDRADRLVTTLIVLLGLITTSAGTFYQLGKIEKQTNGALSAKEQHINLLQAQLMGAGVTPASPPIAAVAPAEDPGAPRPPSDQVCPYCGETGHGPEFHNPS